MMKNRNYPKYGLIFFVIGLALFLVRPVLATGQDDAELGIEMKKGSGSLTAAEALEKAKGKYDKYEKAKTKIAQIFTGTPKEPDSANSPKPEPSQKLDESAKSVRTTAPSAPGLTEPVKKDMPPMTGAHLIRLKNGRGMTGVIREQDKNGFWIEVAPDEKVYLRNDEVKADEGQI